MHGRTLQMSIDKLQEQVAIKNTLSRSPMKMWLAETTNEEL